VRLPDAVPEKEYQFMMLESTTAKKAIPFRRRHFGEKGKVPNKQYMSLKMIVVGAPFMAPFPRNDGTIQPITSFHKSLTRFVIPAE